MSFAYASSAEISSFNPEAAWNDLDSNFWAGFRLSQPPPFQGKTVLEIGCGKGARCFEIAAHGAAEVIGLDPDSDSIRVAEQRLAMQPQERRQRLKFVTGRLRHLPAEQKYDLIVSENTLEHVMDVPAFLRESRQRLKPGGEMYIGFGPLYHAPGGDHAWMRSVLPAYRYFKWPWGHLLFERFALKRLSLTFGQHITTTSNWPFLDLNRHTVAEYRRMFEECGMEIVCFRRNRVQSLAGKLFAAAGRLRMLERHFTLNLFVVLRNA